MGHNMVEHLTNRLYKNYGQNFNSLEHYDIDEIVQHDFFKNDLIESFDEKIGEYKCGKIRRCADTCTVKRVTKI
jgi:hypothetical protein